MQRATPREGIRPRYSGLRVKGTAGSPSSTAEDMLAQEGGCVKKGEYGLWRTTLLLSGNLVYVIMAHTRSVL